MTKVTSMKATSGWVGLFGLTIPEISPSWPGDMAAETSELTSSTLSIKQRE